MTLWTGIGLLSTVLLIGLLDWWRRRRQRRFDDSWNQPMLPDQLREVIKTPVIVRAPGLRRKVSRIERFKERLGR